MLIYQRVYVYIYILYNYILISLISHEYTASRYIFPHQVAKEVPGDPRIACRTRPKVFLFFLGDGTRGKMGIEPGKMGI